jgi:hypothetical protein
MSPRRRKDEDDEDSEGEEWRDDQPTPPLPRSVTDIWERKRRIADSRRAAEKMGAEVLESLREYSKRLKYAPPDYDLGH